MSENIMQKIRIDKVTLNLGAGKEGGKLEKGVKLFKLLTGKEPVKTITNRRIQQWGLRPGLPIGCKVTLRNEDAKKVLLKLLTAKDSVLSQKNFDDNGNFSFGIHEYIEIADFDYIPEIGLLGFEVSVTLERPGYRVKRRRLNRSKIGHNHKINRESAIDFAKEEFSIKIKEEMEEE